MTVMSLLSLPTAALATLVVLGGCATVPPVSGPTLSVAEARASRDGGRDDGRSDVAAGTGRASSRTVDPDGPRSEPRVRWGGTIAEVRNTADGKTVLEIVSRPLRYGGRPVRGDTTDGRFLAEIDAFLDPEIVKSGRDVTVSGQLTGGRDGRIGETVYRYPVVAVDDYRYWKPEAPVSHFPHPSLIHDPYDDFLHDWPHSRHRHPHRRHRSAPGSGITINGTVSFR